MSKQRSSPEPIFADLMSFRVHTLSKLVDQHAESSHRQAHGLSLLEARIVGVVGAHGPISFKSLCVLAELEKSNASRLVVRMIEQGWIERQDDPGDQRSFFLLPTPAGRKLRQAIHREAQARNERWLSVLSVAQRDVFSTCVGLLHAQARTMCNVETSLERANAAPGVKEPEPPRLAWIDLQLADKLYALLGTALNKTPAASDKRNAS